MRQLTILLLLFTTFLTAQDRPLIYYSQVSLGRPIYSGTLGGIIQTGDLNQDGLADMALAAYGTYQVGYARLEGEDLYFDMEPIDFLEADFFYRGQLIDVDADGDIDFSMKRTTGVQPNFYANYIFENEGGKLNVDTTSPPAIFPAGERLDFGKFNEDEITDAYYRQDDFFLIMDGATGETHEPFPDYISLIDAGQAIQLDYNQDGMMDFMIQVDGFPQSDTVVHEVFINEGDYVFTKYATRKFLRAQTYGDFDGDGDLDMFSGAGNGTELSFTIKSNLLSDDMALLTSESINADGYDFSFFPYDLNQDGFDDLIIFAPGIVYYLQNNQDLTFEVYTDSDDNFNTVRLKSDSSWPHGTCVGEVGSALPVVYHFDFDGTNFTVNKSSATISPFIAGSPPYYHRIASIDLDMDGHGELGLSNSFELFAAELKGEEFGEYTAHQFDVDDLPFFTALKSADVNQDGMLDLIYSLPSATNPLQVVFGQADSTFSSPITLSTNYGLCFKIDVADFDGNGWLDIVASGGLDTMETFSIFLNQNGTQFEEKQILPRRFEGWNIFDPNEDGVPDLAISPYPATSTRIYMNDGLANMDSMQHFAGGVIRNQKQHTPYLFLTNGDLVKIDPSGAQKEVIGRTNRAVESRTSYVLDYNLDGMPDLMYSIQNAIVGNPFDTTFLFLSDAVNPWQEQVIPNRYVMGVEDVNRDGVGDVLWEIGVQHWVEVVDSIEWTSLVKAPIEEPLRIYPNPATNYLQFDSVEWEVSSGSFQVDVFNSIGQSVYSNKVTRNRIDVSSLERGAYFLLVTNEKGRGFGGSFLRM